MRKITCSWKSLALLVLFGVMGCQTGKDATISDADDGRVIPAAPLPAKMSVAHLVGEDLGLGGGYLIGAASDKISGSQRAQAVRAARQAEEAPATPEQARNATTADVNGDGFVTLDEVLAMKRAGLSDEEAIGRLRQTGDIFQLTPEQERYLTDRGLSGKVTDAIHQLSGKYPTVVREAGAHLPAATAPTNVAATSGSK